MRRMRLGAFASTVLLAATLAACGDAGDDEGGDGGGTQVEAESDCDDKFEQGTRMAELAEAGTINVGVRFDQPGLGFKGATDDLRPGSTSRWPSCSWPTSASTRTTRAR